jgi:hypothetical protein
MAFMQDPDRGIAEMARVTRPGGTVAACMWDTEQGGMTMLRIFWAAMSRVAPGVGGEIGRPGTSEGDIAARMERAGLSEVESRSLTARAEYEGFDDFWEPFTYAVGPSGQALDKLSEADQVRVREACRAELPDGPFGLDARAWFARGQA